MVDTNRQVPAPSATGWLIDLGKVRGPMFVVLRLTAVEATETLIGHLLEIGAVGSRADAEDLFAEAEVESVAVVW